MISKLNLCSMKEGWEIKKLGEVCEIINGFAFKSQLFKEDGDDILRISNIQNGVIDINDIAHFSKDDYPKVNFEKYAVLPNDIVVALSGATTGKFGINNTGKKLYLNQRVAICREKTSDIHHLFLLYFLQTQSKSFLDSASGVAQPNLSTEQMKQYNIPVPPLGEQERIVGELDCLSGVIEKKKEQLKDLDLLAQSIFYEMFGNPVENDRGWEVKTIGDVCVLKSGDSSANNTSEGTLPYIKVGDMNMEENIPYITTSSTFVSKSENIKGIFPIGTTIFPKRGGAIYTNKKRMTVVEICCDLNTMGVIPMNDVLPLYIYYYFVLLDFAELCNGATIPQINNKDIAPLKVCVPPLSLQQEFASKIEAIEKKKELIRKSIEEVEMLFNSRMDYYFG